MNLKIQTLFALSLCLAPLGCSKDDGDSADKDSTTPTATTGVNGIGGSAGTTDAPSVSLRLGARGVDSKAAAASLLLTAVDPYPGIGINSGEAVVDGLVIWLTGVQLQNQVDSDATNAANRVVQIFDWTAAPKKLQIARGFAGDFNEAVTATIKAGEYNRMAVSMQDKLSLKAYAYLDADNDGAIDTTIYTTAAAIVKVASVLDPAAMPAAYDYYTYGYIGALSADSVTASTKTATTLTVFDQPVTIPEAAANAPVSLDLALVVDTTYLVKAWDGRFGEAGAVPNVRGTGHIPQPQFPFPMDAVPEHGRRHDPGLTQLDFYPEGTPAFGLGNYLPMFAFANVGAASFQVYAFSLDQNYDSFWAPNQAGSYRKTLILTVALDKNGVPLLSRTTTLAEGKELFIGAIGRVFEKAADGTYTFYTDYGVKDATGKDDGGLYYHSDKTMAGHILSGFDAAAAVGAEFQVMEKDGPRCSEEYDYCVGAAGKSLWVKRLK